MTSQGAGEKTVALPQSIYASLGGTIDQTTLQRIFLNLTGATQGGVKEMHLLFQSTGGGIGDGIALYNFFRAYPLDLYIYNGGTVASVAVIAYVGVALGHRYVSSVGNFMIHKSYANSPQGMLNAVKLQAMAASLAADDARIESILKVQTNIPAAHWALHASQDVFFNAQEAVQFGIAHSIREFQVPQGEQIFNV
jgi:ATP-dependent protease ClpP protease subunit